MVELDRSNPNTERSWFYSMSDVYKRQVFLPSTTEVGLSNENSFAEGAAWGYYTINTARIGYLTQQCFTNTPSSSKPSSKTTAWNWWLRTPYYSGALLARNVRSAGSLLSDSAYPGKSAVCAPSVSRAAK